MRILVTGGTGTFGRAFIRRFVKQAAAVISFSRDEQKAAALVEEFGDEKPFKAFLGDVRDRDRLEMAMSGVDVVVHAAALKRVELGAYSPSEIIATNINGTMNVVNAAIAAGVGKVVVISSDKAVEPTNIYGASKYCAETYAVQANAYGFPRDTKISCVRYGNIIGSRGSVYHTWKRQAAAKLPLTITNLEMTRFVMTIEDAVELVRFVIRNAYGGEVFVPILPAATMADLAVAVAGVDYPFEITNLRPGGEKIAESLLNEEEVSRTFGAASRYLAILPSHREWSAEPYPWTTPLADVELMARRPTLYSADPPWFATVDDLRKMIQLTEACR